MHDPPPELGLRTVDVCAVAFAIDEGVGRICHTVSRKELPIPAVDQDVWLRLSASCKRFTGYERQAGAGFQIIGCYTNEPEQLMAFLQTPRDRASLLIFVLAAVILIALAPFLSGLLGAAVLYVVFVHLYKRLERATRPAIAAVITLTCALVIVALPLAWLISVAIAQAPDAMRTFQSSTVFARLADLQVGNFHVGAEVAKASGTIATWLSARVFSFVGSATSAVLNLVIAFFGFYYMLRSDGNSWDTIRSYIPFSAETADALRDRFFSVTEATLLGTVSIGLLQGGLIGTGFWIVGLPSPFFWGTVAAIASILPVLGTALVWLPATLILVVQNRYGAAITMLVIGAGVASNIDNLIRPLIYKRVSHIHPMITLVGAFAGVKYFGLLGVLLGPLAIAYLFALLHFYREEYGEASGKRTVE